MFDDVASTVHQTRGYGDSSLSPPPAFAATAPTVYIAVRATFPSATTAACGSQRRLMLDVSDAATCTVQSRV